MVFLQKIFGEFSTCGRFAKNIRYALKVLGISVISLFFPKSLVNIRRGENLLRISDIV